MLFPPPHCSVPAGKTQTGTGTREEREAGKMPGTKLGWPWHGSMADSPTADLRCPIWASGTRSWIIWQASYTMVEGSNCIIFTTLPMLIFSERATMVAAWLYPLLCHLLEETARLALTAVPAQSPPMRRVLPLPLAAPLLPKSWDLASSGKQGLHPMLASPQGGPAFQPHADPGVSGRHWDPCLPIPRSQSQFCSPAGVTAAGTQRRCCQQGGSECAGAHEISQESVMEGVIIKPAMTQKPQEENQALTWSWWGPTLAISVPMSPADGAEPAA